MKRIALSIALALLPLAAFAHGRALSLGAEQVAPGASITVKGEGIGKSTTATLSLEGVLDTYPLGSVETTEHGEFETTVTIPSDIEPGAYTLKASAGSASASAALKVLAAGATPERVEASSDHDDGEADDHAEGEADDHDEEEAGDHDEGGPAVSTEPLSLDRSMSGGEKAVAWGLFLFAALAGGFLLYKRP